MCVCVCRWGVGAWLCVCVCVCVCGVCAQNILGSVLPLHVLHSNFHEYIALHGHHDMADKNEWHRAILCIAMIHLIIAWFINSLLLYQNSQLLQWWGEWDSCTILRCEAVGQFHQHCC